MKTKKIALYFLVVFLFTSCHPDIKKPVYGDWVIERAFYKDEEVRSCLLLNLITFNPKGEIELPISNSNCNNFNANAASGRWEILETDSIALMLKIESENRVFTGNHRVIFNKDEHNSLYRMEIISDSLYLLCNKKLYDYGNDQKALNKLVDLSHKDQAKWPKNN